MADCGAGSGFAWLPEVSGSLVGAAGFEPTTPSPPVKCAGWFFARRALGLTHFTRDGPGLFPGPCELFDGVADLVIEQVHVARRCLEIGVVERALHELRV